MGKKYVLFDFDGVIANTEESNKRYLEKALKEHGITLTEKDRQQLIGNSDKTVLQNILKRGTFSVSEEELAITRKRIGNTYENTDIQPMPELVPMLHLLREKGIKTAIASSTSTKLIIIALDKMGMTSLFDTIVCGDMCTKSKPHPQIYQQSMEYLGAKPEECIVIEDSTAGITAGKRAGAYVIAYLGSGLQQDIHEADFSVKTYIECKEKLCELFDFNI